MFENTCEITNTSKNHDRLFGGASGSLGYLLKIWTLEQFIYLNPNSLKFVSIVFS